MECAFADCEKPRASRGLCPGHYEQVRRGKKLTPLRHKTTNTVTKQCSFDGCGRDAASRGLCKAHYHQSRTRKTLTPLRERNVRPANVSDEDWFMTLTDKQGPDDCWLWLGGKDSAEYGVFYSGPTRHYAHRFSYQMAHGVDPAGATVARECSRTECVNPAHLYLILPIEVEAW